MIVFTHEALKERIREVITLAQLCADADLFKAYEKSYVEKREKLFNDLESLFRSADRDIYAEVYCRVGGAAGWYRFNELQVKHCNMPVIANRMVELVAHAGELDEKVRKEEKVRG